MKRHDIELSAQELIAKALEKYKTRGMISKDPAEVARNMVAKVCQQMHFLLEVDSGLPSPQALALAAMNNHTRLFYAAKNNQFCQSLQKDADLLEAELSMRDTSSLTAGDRILLQATLEIKASNKGWPNRKPSYKEIFEKAANAA